MADEAAHRHPRLLFYHDGRHPLIYMYEPPITQQQHDMDELLGTPADGLCFCLGDGRTVLHDTKVGERWGHHFTETNDQWSHEIFRRAAQNMEQLIADGVDPLRCVCERGRAKGLPVYPTLLVNQGGGESYASDTRTSDFWLENSHLRIGAKTTPTSVLPPWFSQESAGRCMDFMHAEVREERFALVQETLQNYDCAGLELQLNYQAHYFHPSEVEAGREVMTDWVRRCYEAVKASGDGRLLIIRVPASSSGCLTRGLDVEAWISLGIVDVIAGQVFLVRNARKQLPGFWYAGRRRKCSRRALQCARNAAATSTRTEFKAPIQMIRGAACNYLAQGDEGSTLPTGLTTGPRSQHSTRAPRAQHAGGTEGQIVFVSTETGRYDISQFGLAIWSQASSGAATVLRRQCCLLRRHRYTSGRPRGWRSPEKPGTIRSNS